MGMSAKGFSRGSFGLSLFFRNHQADCVLLERLVDYDEENCQVGGGDGGTDGMDGWDGMNFTQPPVG